MTQADSSLIAVVTGANRGIGLEVVRQLARQGITVILGARDLEKGKTAAEPLLTEGLQVLPHKLDVTDPASINQLAAHLKDEFGRIDVLVNNAGILYDTWESASNANLNTVQDARLRRYRKGRDEFIGTLAHVASVSAASAS